MNNLKEVNEQIEANKEILNTFPRNNAKNIKACLTQIQEYKQTFTDAQSKLLEEMKKRIEKSKITKRISIGLLVIFYYDGDTKTRTHTEKEELSYEKKFHEKGSSRNAYCSNGVFPYCMWRW